MAGYNRPEGGWNFVFDGINLVDVPDALQPTQYAYARNVRGLSGRAIQTRPGYSAYSTTPNLVVSCPLTPTGQDAPYSSQLSATGGIPPYTYTISDGSLPDGLTLSSSGLLSGTPTTSGDFSFTLTVTDAAGGSDSVSCSIYIYPASTSSDWIGCLAGSFLNPSDWTSGSSVSIGGGQASVGGLGFAYNVSGGCGSGLEQEVWVIYNSKGTVAGARGYYLTGPGVRMSGANLAVLNGYFFCATMWGGSVGTLCGYTGLISLTISKLTVGVFSNLTSITIAGPDLTPGTPMSITCEIEGGGARIKGYLSGIQQLSYLDASPLAAGYPGLASVFLCSGNPPNPVSYSFVKARNL